MRVLREFHDAIGRLVKRFDATVGFLEGDGVQLFFNDPIEIPDAPLRAVRLGCALREEMAELTPLWQKRGYDLDFGAGIALGYATCGEVGFEGRSDYAAIGAVTNLASRLADEASGGQILIAQRLYAEVEDAVDAEPVGEFTLKGFQRPVAAFNVIAVHDRAATEPSSPSPRRASGVRRGGSRTPRDREGTPPVNAGAASVVVPLHPGDDRLNRLVGRKPQMKGTEMKRRTVQMKALFIFVGILAVAGTTSLSAASAKPRKVAPVPPDAVLTWNTNAVNAVRASSPAKFQVEGLIYMSYVQAAVYDAVTKIAGRYQPYHDFAFTVAPGASVQAAVAAAARTMLDNYLPDQQAPSTPNTTPTSRRSRATSPTASRSARPRRTTSSPSAAVTAATRPRRSYGTIGPILPGQWQLQSPTQTAQTPWVATMRPFLLDQASQFRADPPPSLTSHQYAKDLNETEAYGALNSTVRTPDETAIAYFWNANAINQYNQTMQNVVTQRTAGPRRRSAPGRNGRTGDGRRRDRPASTPSTSTSPGGRSPRSRTPTRTAIPIRPPTRHGRRSWRRPPTLNTRPRTAASRAPSPTRSQQPWARIIST